MQVGSKTQSNEDTLYNSPKICKPGHGTDNMEKEVSTRSTLQKAVRIPKDNLDIFVLEGGQ